MLLGAIADDLTGATDLALTLARGGMRTVQVMGVPDDPHRLRDMDAVVVALKSRTNDPAEAVAWSLASCDALLSAGAEQIIFKYCSTFDSTAQGNIGPVAEALLEKLGDDLAVVCPAFPTNKRTIFRGHLFVGDQLLSDSPMKDHPLTPMRDANLVSVMQAQSRSKVGLVAYEAVDAGPQAITAAFDAARASGQRFVVCDAINDRHLMSLGEAIAHHRLVTGGSGIALGLPANFVRAGKLAASDGIRPLQAKPGRAAILSGSCSQATRGQVAHAIGAGLPARRVDAMELAAGKVAADQLVAFALAQPADHPVLIYSSEAPEVVGEVQRALGRDAAGHLVERLMAEVARGLVKAGFTRLIVAGGETSGAVVGGLEVQAIEIGPEIDPGVPWTRSLDDRQLALALKSGNFGGPDFFTAAWGKLA
ncbi:MAG: four-carbon acid sugar kinase family protein [Hyphomicrobiaceae bacterium]|nr:four-carbon acid sugar kinase family protein [Hyphomicrobiaceae bacterium]